MSLHLYFNESIYLEEPPLDGLIIRQSDIESMMLCPARKGYADHPDIDSRSSEPMVFGSLAHSVIEQLLIDPDSTPTIKSTLDLLEPIMTRDGWGWEDTTTPDYPSIFQLKALALDVNIAAEKWVTDWFQHQPPFEVLAIEQIVYRQLAHIDGTDIWLQGTPDLVLANGVVDWKTAGRGWDNGKAALRIQTPIYHWLCEQIRGTREGIGEYIVYNRQQENWTVHHVDVTEAQVTAALHTALEYAKLMLYAVYPPTPYASAGKTGRGWWCSPQYCNAWNVCTYKALVADGKADQPAPTTTWK